jgi:hypothetical protein
VDEGGGGIRQGFLAVSNGFRYSFNDLVDVFVGTGGNIRGPKTQPVRGRFKGVRIEGGVERFLVRPFVGSQRGKCPSYPPESCMKLKAFGSDMYGESKPQYFSKMTPSLQERYGPLSPPPYLSSNRAPCPPQDPSPTRPPPLKTNSYIN